MQIFSTTNSGLDFRIQTLVSQLTGVAGIHILLIEPITVTVEEAVKTTAG